MKVTLVSKTLPLVAESLTPEEFVVYTARVSNPTNQMNTETAPKLIKFLIKYKHWSPFEMVDFCFEIQTSRAIAAQILRHRSANFQEFSQRYAQSTAVEEFEPRLQDNKNRQNSFEIDPASGEYGLTKKLVDQHFQATFALYEKLLEQGIAKESARMVLPMATQTTLYMKNNLRNWIHYVDLRSEQGTQKEHRMIALEIKRILTEECPNVALACGWREE
ncbi:Thymidylate synthase thyX [Thalassoporum mexicanum PCC 7367]|uniref:FAD-dependent thymidylate synthase n=1 Tax=Thalassoporum mexicanum TaxID=3457544 RepID=UPI00029FEC2E|nr:FAD-dependent thymidylate synthase [Pseudanabaena sp. PCC 7367]AFY71201.1 Thymidylate synthase thyX [Pseudanabaena sp. PCC 7367]